MEPFESQRPRAASWVRVLGVLFLAAGLGAAAWFTKDVIDGADPKGARHLATPDRSAVEAAITTASRSTVKIEGSACGLATAGSGVVVGDGVVLTAAHVVAGATESRVVDSTGSHRAVAVLVDPLADLAVLYSDGLSDEPVTISSTPAGRGTAAVVLGYPRGGQLHASPAVVLDSYRAEQNDIYGREQAEREILEVQAPVVPGSSGGPVVDSKGELIGIVFGQSQGDPDVGFAVTATAIDRSVEAGRRAAETGARAVSTGDCLTTTTS
ncbi:MAG TPA: trypsin-like peptidase domain-containing protein [Ilumatobacteraceae bacterium]|nr:trypsin-like peptidase domain-containing protein [Ilumatobacteraceae bacterium]